MAENRSIRPLLLALAAAAILPQVTGGQEDPGVVFRAESVLIEVEVRVTGRGGKPVAGLSREDFTVTENGKAQAIEAFEYVPEIGERETPASSRPHTWVYIGTQIGPESVPRVREALEQFVEDQILPGMAVAINGGRFEADRDRLLSIVRSKSLTDVASGTLYSEQFDAGGEPGQRTDTPAEEREIDRARRTLTARALLHQHIDLIRQMGQLPGKRVIVLFSHGLRIRSSAPGTISDLTEGDLQDLYRRLSAEATRYGVSIYPVDARGLEAFAPGGDASFSDATRGPIGARAVNADDRRMTQHGLATLAELTGGKAVLNSNDLGSVFAKVREDLGGYYVLGYYPSNRNRKGKERKIRVTVTQPGVRLAYRKSYYEDLDFTHMSRAQKRKQLEEIVLSDDPYADLPVDTAFHFHRDGVWFTTALLPGARWSPPDPRSRELRYTFIATARDAGGRGKPVFTEVNLQKVYSPAEWERLRKDPAAFLRFPGEMRLAPGRYVWKAVVRDEASGAIGTYQSRLEVPDYSEALTSSSLLLTPRLLSVHKAGSMLRGTVPFKAAALWAAPETPFERGMLLFMHYDLYNVPEDLLRKPPQPRVYLLHEGNQIEEPPFQGYEVVDEKDKRTLRYLASLDTAKLDPGEYRLVVPLPGGENAIFRDFAVEEKP